MFVCPWKGFGMFTSNFRLRKISPGSDSYASSEWENLEKLDRIGNGLSHPREAGDTTSIYGYSPQKVKIPGVTIRPNEDGTLSISLGRAGDKVTIKGEEFGSNVSDGSVSNWDSSISYTTGNLVYQFGLLFKCISNHTSTVFSQDLEFWECLTLGAGIVDQPSSPLSEFSSIRYDGTEWVGALADSVDTLSDPPTLVVSSGVSKFLYSMSGVIKKPNSFVSGQTYFLSEIVPGEVTTAEPTIFSNPIFKCLSNGALVILPYRPSEVA